jgi:co-chaperonin GroES (HSP10)
MRNNGVLLSYIQREAQKIGAIQLAGNLDREIEHAIVVGVGPGTMMAGGAVSGTHDLKEGDYVLVKARQIRKPSVSAPEQITEMRVPVVLDGKTYSLVDESQIIMSIDRPAKAVELHA